MSEISQFVQDVYISNEHRNLKKNNIFGFFTHYLIVAVRGREIDILASVLQFTGTQYNSYFGGLYDCNITIIAYPLHGNTASATYFLNVR